MIRVLYVSYATWKLAAVAGLTVYERAVAANTVSVWVGTRDVAYHTDVEPSNYADYTTNYPSGQVSVPGEDEALALILNTDTVLDPRTPSRVPLFSQAEFSLQRTSYRRIDDNSEDMSLDGAAAGTPVVIWNGTGAGDTGGDWTTGGIGSAETAAAHAGTEGWDSGVSALNDVSTFDGGANQDIDGTYDELSFWLNPQAFPPSSALRVFWRNAAGTPIGNNVRVDNVVTNMDLGVWQRVVIPIADFGLDADVDKLVFRYAGAASQQHYIDDIKVNDSAGGGPFRFQIAAPTTVPATRYHLSMAVLVISAPASGWTPTAFANIVGGLESGLIFRQRRVSDSEILWTFNTRDNTDLYGFFHPQDDVVFSGGEMLVGFMVKPGKATVVITDDDVLEVVVRDDLSSLTSMRAYAHYGVEVASQ